MKKKGIIISLLAAIVLGVGLFVPVGTYTTSQGCPIEPTPKKRLSVIRGDSIANVKSADVAPSPTEGCSANTKFTLYFL